MTGRLKREMRMTKECGKRNTRDPRVSHISGLPKIGLHSQTLGGNHLLHYHLQIFNILERTELQ